MYYYKKTVKKNNFLLYFVLFLIACVAGIVYYSKFFERVAPEILVDETLYWNLEKPIKVSLSDNVGLRSYRVYLLSEDGSRVSLLHKKANGEKNIDLNVTFHKSFFPKGNTKLVVEAKDKSLWNFLMGNQFSTTSNIIIDRKPPTITIIKRSYSISLGGAAVVIFGVQDENLQDIKITTNHNQTFESVPFYKKGYYIALIPRDLRTRGFKSYIEAVDKASNKRRLFIPFFNKNVKYNTSKIKLTSSFLSGKISELYETNYQDEFQEDELKRFVKVNETLRKKGSSLIDAKTKHILENAVDDFKISKFEPLKNYSKVASFGDHRYFYSGKTMVSESYHLGIDLANTKNGAVFSNAGKVIFAANNGIYGKMPIIYHGLGLYSVYGHCDTLFIEEGQTVKPNEIIARTGKTGLALGDHLHFEVRIQGIPVRPIEWLDEQWISYNIEKPIQEAKKYIDDEQ